MQRPSLAVLALGAMILSPPDAVSQVEGAWIATAWESGGQAITPPQRGLLVFTEHHYSIMFVVGNAPRARYEGESLTDAEKLVAYDSFVANSGRYRISGNTLTTMAYMAKDPNYMGDWEGTCASDGACKNAVELTIRVDGDVLQVQWSSGLKGTFRRVE